MAKRGLNLSSRRRQQQPPQFRNIPLTSEMVAMGFTDIQVQAQNMVLRHQDGLIILARYDVKDLAKTVRLLESQLAEYIGKPRGLPDNFNPKAFTAVLSIALLNDLQDQYAQNQEVIEEEKRRVQSTLDEIRELREENSDISFNEWQRILVAKYRNLKNTVELKLPKIWPGLEFGLSSLRILNIDDCTLPFIGVLLGRPGSGKTVAITLLSKWVYGYYTDSFSPKAWVSHTTSVNSQEELEAVDMLPKMRDKQFLTPELATLFNLKEDDLRLSLATITRIADGHGFASDSGVYGHRAYGDTMFTWLGAVVDIPYQVYKVLGSLGPKLYFFRLPYTETTPIELLTYLTDRDDFNMHYQTIEAALFDYLKWFEIGPTLLLRTPDSPHLVKMRWDGSRDELDAMQCIVNLAILLGHLRREGRAYIPNKAVKTDDEKDEGYSYFTGDMEDVQRTATVLKNKARGHALITGRNYVTMDDIPIVVKTVLSTSRVERVKAFIALLDNNGWITKTRLASQLHVSPSTAYRFMTELKAIGLVDIEVTNRFEYTQKNNPAQVKVMILAKDKFEWFVSDEFKKLREDFTPVDNRKYIHEEDPEKQAATEAASIAAEAAKTQAGLGTEASD
jgi:predicted transcriptional regulator